MVATAGGRAPDRPGLDSVWAMSAPAATRMTAEQYFATSVEGDRTQLIDGRMIVNEPELEHALIQTRLIAELSRWIEAVPGRGFASVPADVVVSRHDVYAPDVLWL